ncbi:MAG: phospholipase D-like domain-containing protein [Methanoregula sp.]|nr:phospholipase D-like domain-containing protein [Methanoregula sp.]
MAKFSTTNGVSAAIDELVKSARKRLFLISPYIQISKNLRSLIKEADRQPLIDIKVICRKDSNWSPDDISFLQDLENAKLKSIEGLHAKIYLNESTAIITSMNLYLHSQQNNKEVGLIFDAVEDKVMYDQIFLEVTRLIEDADKIQYKVTLEKEQPVINKPEKAKEKPFIKVTSPQISNKGYCIRCRAEIPLNPDEPLCSKDLKSWARWGKREYPEKYCHICGKESEQSVAKPVCISCYKKSHK